MSELWNCRVWRWARVFCRHLWQFQHSGTWPSSKTGTQRRLGWKRHYYLENKAVLLQSNSRYFPARCVPLLWAVHMPPLIPHRPRGRLKDYPFGSWETQNTSRSTLLWLTATNPPEALHPSSACANQSPNRPQTTPQIFRHHNKPQSVINLAHKLQIGCRQGADWGENISWAKYVIIKKTVWSALKCTKETYY